MSSVSSSPLLIVVFGVVFVLVVSLCRTCCLVVHCQLGCRCRGDKGRGSCWLVEFAAYEVTLRRVAFRATLCRGETGRVAREIVLVSVDSCWMWVLSRTVCLCSLACARSSHFSFQSMKKRQQHAESSPSTLSAG